MTPAERLLWQRVQRRAAMASPELAAAILAVYALIREQVGDDALARAIQAGGSEDVFRTIITTAMMELAMQPVRARLRRTVTESVKYFARDLPLPPSRNGVLRVGFDILNPNVITAVRQLETRVMTTLKDSVRETTRAVIENGLRTGKSPIATARSLRSVIGLAPNQELAIRNFEAALRGEGNALGYALRDRRFDAVLKKGTPTEPQIERMVAGYRRKMLAFNAETNARTATLDALKLGQRLSWQQAIDDGSVVGTLVKKRWVGVMDKRERPSHIAMEGATVGFDDEFPNGQMIPGDDEWNCRCIAKYYVARGDA